MKTPIIGKQEKIIDADMGTEIKIDYVCGEVEEADIRIYRADGLNERISVFFINIFCNFLITNMSPIRENTAVNAVNHPREPIVSPYSSKYDPSSNVSTFKIIDSTLRGTLVSYTYNDASTNVCFLLSRG
jgi:hypothetical protein